MVVSVLKEGSTGPEVIDLQFILKFRDGKNEFDPGATDGSFGSKTKAAVVKFQQSRKLTADGIVGGKTWEALRPRSDWPKQPGEFLREGEKGEVVKQLQEGLKSDDFYTGPIDGIFGSNTKAAVIKTQKSGEISSNTVGVVGPLTWGGIIGD
ncbi:MAG: peptidoglycan-binding protein [Brasilonema octagenarum HA4186-MV1]|jgi:peptidoglycan hydrolase-like protein with peptidoglycan-binding domain|nr:peptidoglycan-binding protein [Brasilonema octagenarum HA4186-MV1]